MLDIAAREHQAIESQQHCKAINQRFTDMVHLCGLVEVNIQDMLLTNRPSLTSKCRIRTGLSYHNIIYRTSHLIPWREKPVSLKIFLWTGEDLPVRQREVVKPRIECRQISGENSPVQAVGDHFKDSMLKFQDKHAIKDVINKSTGPRTNGELKRLARQKRRALQKSQTYRK